MAARDPREMTDEDLGARLKEVIRLFKKYDQRYGRCNYFSPRGLAYAKALRELEAERKSILAELDRRKEPTQP
jgi:hypothetical protein